MNCLRLNFRKVNKYNFRSFESKYLGTFYYESFTRFSFGNFRMCHGNARVVDQSTLDDCKKSENLVLI